MTKEEKLRQKELSRKIKAINNSLTFLNKEKQSEIDVLAVQKEDAVFFCGKNTYKKIYTVSPASLEKKRNAFIKALSSQFDYRFRFTVCVNNSKRSHISYMFLTVSFEADDYFNVREKIESFEKNVVNNICSFLDISISACTLESAVSYIRMNTFGDLEKISSDFLFKSSKNEKMFCDVSDCKRGSFVLKNHYGHVFTGKNYEKDTANISRFINSHFGEFFVVVDFQKFSDEEQHLYDFSLRNKYSLYNEKEKAAHINMTYLIAVMSDTKEANEDLSDEILSCFDSNGVLLMPCSGRENVCFYSCCSLGLLDFRSGHAVNFDIAGGLLL